MPMPAPMPMPVAWVDESPAGPLDSLDSLDSPGSLGSPGSPDSRQCRRPRRALRFRRGLVLRLGWRLRGRFAEGGQILPGLGGEDGGEVRVDLEGLREVAARGREQTQLAFDLPRW